MEHPSIVDKRNKAGRYRAVDRQDTEEQASVEDASARTVARMNIRAVRVSLHVRTHVMLLS